MRQKLVRWISFILLFSIPIAFSHLPHLFWIAADFSYFGNYNGLKIACFALGMTGALFLWLPEILRKISTRDIAFFVLLVGIGIGHVIQDSNVTSALFGTSPLFLSIWFVSMVWVWTLSLRHISPDDWKIGKNALFLSFAFVCVYAFVQALWFDPITTYDRPFSAERAFSSLGNPNSLAFYLLLFLPFFFELKARWMRVGAFLCTWIAIFLSWSLSAIWIFIAYIVYMVNIRCKKMTAILLSVVIVIFCIGTLSYGPSTFSAREKILSFQTRTVLVKETFDILGSHPTSVMYWVSPRALAVRLQDGRTEELRSYVDEHIGISDFHVLPVDLAVRFGLPFGIFLLYLAVSLFQKWNRFKREILFVFLFYSLVHIPSVTEWMILIFALCRPSGWPPVRSLS